MAIFLAILTVIIVLSNLLANPNVNQDYKKIITYIYLIIY